MKPIYKFDAFQVALDLMPPILRTLVHHRWISVLVSPIHRIWELAFHRYKKVSTPYVEYFNGLVYVYGNEVLHSDNSVYMCIKDNTGESILN